MIVKNLNEWCFKNLDLIEECLETNGKAVILIAGASSSGKSHCSEFLKEFLNKHNLKCLILSTDNYSVGISGIVTNKVNNNYFNEKLENLDDIKDIIKNTIIDSDFGEKFCEKNKNILREKLFKYFDKNTDDFIDLLTKEFENINFDETSVYDLKLVASDLINLLNNETIKEKIYNKSISERQLGKEISGFDYDIILVEGIFALNKALTENLVNLPIIKNFVECDSKTLFLRRVIRDKKITTASSTFIVKNYFEKVISSYYNDIYPSKDDADLIIENNMTFEELRTGEIYSSQIKKEVFDLNTVEKLRANAEKEEIIIQRDIYLKSENEINSFENILRIRLIKNEGQFELFSLIHKGNPKHRKDNKLIRPINILVNDGELVKVATTEKELLEIFSKANLVVDKIIEKKRLKVLKNNIEYTIDELENGKIFVELTSMGDDKILKAGKEKIAFDLIEIL